MGIRSTVILFEEKSQKERIIKFFEKNGIMMQAIMRNATPNAEEYYGVNQNGDRIFTRNPGKYNVIKLPKYKRKSFPREMMVSDNGIDWYKREVIATCKSMTYKFIAVMGPYKSEDNFTIGLKNWKFAKEIKYEEDNSGKLDLL